MKLEPSRYGLNRFPHWIESRRWSFLAWILANSRAIEGDEALASLVTRLHPRRRLAAYAAVPETLTPSALRLVAQLKSSFASGPVSELARQAEQRLGSDPAPDNQWFHAQVAARRLLRRARSGRLSAYLLADSLRKGPWRYFDGINLDALEAVAATIHGFAAGRKSEDEYLAGVHRLLGLIRTYSDGAPEAYLEAALVEACFAHPLLVFSSGGALATSLPVSIQITDDVASPSIIDGKFVKHLQRNEIAEGEMVGDLWDQVFGEAVAAARNVLLAHRRHFGSDEVHRLRNTRVLLDLSPADAIMSEFGEEIRVHDSSAGASFVSAAAAALLGRSPPATAATGRVQADGAIGSVASIDGKFRYAAASRHFDLFCYPAADGLNSLGSFQALLALQQRDHVTLARVTTVEDVLDASLGPWRRYRVLRAPHLQLLRKATVDQPNQNIAVMMKDAAPVWTPPDNLSIADLLLHLLGSSRHVHERNQRGQSYGIPGISHFTLELSATDAAWPLSALLWDLSRASDASYQQFATTKSEAEQLQIFADEVMRTRPFGGTASERGPDLLILANWNNYLSATDVARRDPELARLFGSAHIECLRDPRREEVWKRLIGDVRVVLMPGSAEPRFVSPVRHSIDIEDQVLLSVLSHLREPAPTPRIAAVLPKNFGSFDSVLDLDRWINDRLGRGGLAVRSGGRWFLSDDGRRAAAQTNSFGGEPPAHYHMVAAKTYAPQMSSRRADGASSLSEAFWGLGVYEYMHHQLKYIRSAKTRSRVYLHRYLTESLAYDFAPNWDVVLLCTRKV